MTRIEALRSSIDTKADRFNALRASLAEYATRDAEPSVEERGQFAADLAEFDAIGPEIEALRSELAQLEAVLAAPAQAREVVSPTVMVRQADPFADEAVQYGTLDFNGVAVPSGVTVTGVADSPTVTVQNATGNEDAAIPLNLQTALTDTDGSESITAITITGIPNGATLTGGTNNGAITVTNGSATLTPAQLTNLKITPPANSDADFTLKVTATSAEGGTTATSAQVNLAVTVNAVADALRRAQAGQTEPSIALGALPPGDYIVRAIVGLDGQPAGRTLRTLRLATSSRK